MTLHVDLNNPALEAMVQQHVAAGLYGSASEMVGVALERMARADKLVQLRADIQEGLESGSAGVLDIEAVIARANARRDGTA